MNSDPPEADREHEGNGPAQSDAIQQEEERLRKAAERSARAAASRPTTQLRPEDRAFLPSPIQLPFGTRFGTAQQYLVLPAHMAHGPISPETPHWRIELHGLAPGVGALGLDLVGDIVIGRNTEEEVTADLDLTSYGALDKGVSRRHALLRPTRAALYLIDLGSTNGTMHNALPLGAGIARALKHNDTLTFGRLSCTLKIIDGPGLHIQDEASPGTRRTSSPSSDTRPLDPKRR